MAESWTWPPQRALTLYHWSWFDPALGDVVVGWSLRSELDAHGFIHLEAERHSQARSVAVDQEGDPVVEAHTFTAFTPLPLALTEEDGRPLSWIRVLLGDERTEDP